MDFKFIILLSAGAESGFIYYRRAGITFVSGITKVYYGIDCAGKQLQSFHCADHT